MEGRLVYQAGQRSGQRPGPSGHGKAVTSAVKTLWAFTWTPIYDYLYQHGGFSKPNEDTDKTYR